MRARLLRAHQDLAHRLGALPARRVIWGLAALFCGWILLDVFALQFTSGLARHSFDAMTRARILVAPADPRILVLDIDESSLQKMAGEFGRWPWPRDTLASVLEYVEKQQPAAIVWDVLFSDADRLSPGGDAAFDAAVQRSPHSHFSVVRLENFSDAQSQLSRSMLPTLWVPTLPAADSGNKAAATVALIPPALPAVAHARLGYNNGYVDSDGVLRRYRNFEVLRDGSAIQSIAMSVLSAIDPPAYAREVAALSSRTEDRDELIAWRRSSKAYPHYPIADVFEAADTGKVSSKVPELQGKVVIIGSTAASLHDIHPTPLDARHPGVDSLATAIDNALNQRHQGELSRWQHALIAMVLCIVLAAWVQHRKMASLSIFFFALPAALLFISYLTLNGAPVFIDLQLSAALALLFLAVLRYWNQLRRNYWCNPVGLAAEGQAVWPLGRAGPWTEGELDRLIDWVERRLPAARIIAPDVQLQLFQQMRWPELAHHAAIVGTEADLRRLHQQVSGRIGRLCWTCRPITPLPELPASAAGPSLEARRSQIAQQCMQLWSAPQIPKIGDSE